MSVAGPMPSSPAFSFLDFDPAPLLRRPTPSTSKAPSARRPVSLKRSASYLTLPTLEQASQPLPPAVVPAVAPVQPSMEPLYTLPRRSSSLTPASSSSRTQRVVGRIPAQEPLPRAWTPSFSSASRPSPPPPSKSRRNTTSRFLPPRERYPKAKAEPDLYRTALLRRMNGTPEGRAMLHMGVRFAVSMLEATRALEGLVEAQCADADDDTDEDGRLALVSSSWVDVPLDDQPWEMVDTKASA